MIIIDEDGIMHDVVPIKVRDEIQDAYNDNKECGQEDVAYGLKIALDIIEEYR